MGSLKEVQRRLDLSLEDIVDEEKKGGHLDQGKSYANGKRRKRYQDGAGDGDGDNGYSWGEGWRHSKRRWGDEGWEKGSWNDKNEESGNADEPDGRHAAPPSAGYLPGPPPGYGPYSATWAYNMRPPVVGYVRPAPVAYVYGAPPGHCVPAVHPGCPPAAYPAYPGSPGPYGLPPGGNLAAPPGDVSASPQRPLHQGSPPGMMQAQPSAQEGRGYQVRLSNVPPELTARDLAEAFGEVSQTRVETVDLLRDRSGVATGAAVVVFGSMADAKGAVLRYNGGDLNGRRLKAIYEGPV